MELIKSDIISPYFFALSVRPIGGSLLTGVFDGDHDILITGGINDGCIATPERPIDNYLWLEIVVQNRANNTGIFFVVANNNNGGSYEQIVQSKVEVGAGSQGTFIVPYIGPIDELVFYGVTGTFVVKNIRSVQRDSRLTKADPIATGDATLTSTAPGPLSFVYNSVSQEYRGQIAYGATDSALLTAAGLLDDYDWLAVRVQFADYSSSSQPARVNLTVDGNPLSFKGEVVEFWISGDAALNTYPKLLALDNSLGSLPSVYTVTISKYSWPAEQVNAFGMQAVQVLQDKPTFLGSGNILSGLTGWVYANAGIATAFALIPLAAINFVGGNIAGLNSLDVVSADIDTITGAGIFAGRVAFASTVGGGALKANGQFFYNDFSQEFGLGIGNFPGTFINIDNQLSTHNAGARIGILNTSWADGNTVGAGGLVGVWSALATLTNGAYVIPQFVHFYAQNGTGNLGVAVTNVYGFFADANLTNRSGAAYGFYSGLDTGVSKWGFYSAGTASSHYRGGISVGNNTLVNTSETVRLSLSPNASATTYSLAYGLLLGTTVQTATLRGFYTDVRSAVAAYTVTDMRHFEANTSTKGAGSTITSIYGFYANNAIAVGTNNYGFYSDINSATNTWQMALNGTGSSYSLGRLGVGRNSALGTADRWLDIGGSLNVISSYSVVNSPTFNSSVTTLAVGYYSDFTTQNAAFTTSTIYNFAAFSAAKGAAHTITVSAGFAALNAVAVGTTSYGFFTDFSFGTTKWGFYSSSTASNFFGGSVAILNANSGNDVLLRIGGSSSVHPNTGTTIYGTYLDLTAPATATATFSGNSVILRTTNSAFTLTAMYGYRAQGFAKGALSTITVVAAFIAEAGIQVGTSNYGFYSLLASASNDLGFYAAGTAQSTFLGTVNFGVANSGGTVSAIRIQLPSTVNAASVHTVYANPTFPATSTTEAGCFVAEPSTVNSVFTLPIMAGFYCKGFTKGAAALVTTAIGFYAGFNIGAVAATLAIGFYCDMAAAAGKYQLYMNGSALNFIKGGVILDTTAAPAVAAGQLSLGATVAATVGAAGAGAALPATPVGYWIINVAGTQMKVPYYNT